MMKSPAKCSTSSTSLSLPRLLTARQQIDPFRSTLKKDIIDSLLNGHYRMSNDGDIAYVCDTITGAQTDPTTESLLLYGTKKGKLKVCQIQECDYAQEFIVKDICCINFHDDPVEYCEWYPADSGMFAILQPRTLHIVDAQTFDIANSVPQIDPIGSSDWNTRDPFVIALSCETPHVKLFDIRSGENYSSITISADLPVSNSSTSTSSFGSYRSTRVFWSPLDQYGLFVGDSIGDIFFYDTRRLTKPAASRMAARRHLLRPITFIGMPPDRRHLITAHGGGALSNHVITQWRFAANRAEFLLDTRLNCASSARVGGGGKRAKIAPGLSTAQRVTLLCAQDYIYAPNGDRRGGPDIYCFDRSTGERVPRRELRHSEMRRPAMHVIGYRRTARGDDPNPAVIYTGVNHIVVSRMSTYAEPFETTGNAIKCSDGGGAFENNVTTSADTAAIRRTNSRPNALQQDRWSDSD